MVYTYVIRSEKDKKWYTGTTTDLRKRLNEHNDNKVISTKNRGPFELIYYEGCIDINDAFTRERYLKTGMGKRYLRNRLRRFLSLTGQAILELAIFGSILIMLLGGLISYGLAYSARQKLIQQTFRKALAAAAVSGPNFSNTPISVSYSQLKDTHIPNPSDPFAVGSITPVSGRATVTRNYMLDANAENDNELPELRINIQGNQYGPFKTAGFRNEYNIPAQETSSSTTSSFAFVISGASSAPDSGFSALDKYNEIYGSANVLVTGDGVCVNEETSINPETGEAVTTCLEDSKNIQILDSFAGEIYDYGSAVRRCRQIVDVDACTKECERGSGDDCASICSAVMNSPNQNTNVYNSTIGGAWYCADYYAHPDGQVGKYVFPKLEQLFGYLTGTDKGLGLQNDYTQVSTMNNKLERTEDTIGINTTDTLDWDVSTTRDIVYRDKSDSSGDAPPLRQTVTTDVCAEKDGSGNCISKTQPWGVSW